MPEEIKVSKGLENVIVDKTAIATTSKAGDLLYRGYKAIDLAEKKSFEETAFLIIYGKLPGENETARFKETITKNSEVVDSVREIMRITKEKDVMRNIRSMISLYPYKEIEKDKIFLKMDSIIPQLASDSFSALTGKPFKEPTGKGFSERFYSLISTEGSEEHARSFQKLMILYMEHEFNASTFALRVATSTLTDPVSA
ncbi:Citrate (Si)-synthase, partial [mine drainage metagenome]